MGTKTRQELAADYGIDRRTLYRWLKEAEIILSGKGGALTPIELKIIYEKFGEPQKMR